MERNRSHDGCGWHNGAVTEQTLPHVTLAGDYRVEEERPDGTLVLRPDTSVDAIFRRNGAEPATMAEFEAEYGPVGEPDGEG